MAQWTLRWDRLIRGSVVALLDAPSIPAGLQYLSVPERRDSPSPPGSVFSRYRGLFAWENPGWGQGLWIMGEPWLGAGTVDHGRTVAGGRDCRSWENRGWG